jgi:hypothetical protein
MRIDGGDVCEFGRIPSGVLGDEPSRPDHLYDERNQRAMDSRSNHAYAHLNEYSMKDMMRRANLGVLVE